MESNYFIVSKTTSILLFTISYEHKNEGPAVLELQAMMKRKRDLQTEDTIRDLYAKLRGRYDHVSDPIELLRMLLANGNLLRVETSHSKFDLYKDYFPISFEAKSDKQTIGIGDYYRSSTSSHEEQFIAFGQRLDFLSGFEGMNRMMANQFISAGLSIVVHDGKDEFNLVRVSSKGAILEAKEDVLRYLFKDSVD